MLGFYVLMHTYDKLTRKVETYDTLVSIITDQSLQGINYPSVAN